MRHVRLELLRHGPPHNQLLSPLTPYLALCENHAPVTLNVSFEHNQFLHRLSALTYELNDQQRQFQLRDTGQELGRLLGAIPGLTAELNRECENGGSFTHLRLILSASELALLPFELALAVNGFPGDGQPLLLQEVLPLCLTREVRRVGGNRLSWPRDARVLFVAAAPAGLPAVPLESHLLALRRAVAPWVGHFDTGDTDARRKAVEKRLKLLPRASIEAIERECADGSYTHVHVLAHGVAHPVGFDLRFGIALHDDNDPDGPADVVSGERLARALRPALRPGQESLVRPMVVTLASCNSGNTGSVVGAGSSVAHALHEAGIPLVVAGQFPLTFGGSVKLVETMYEGLLWGADPRGSLVDLRRQLYAMRPDHHDWASVTAYAALPVDFENQLADVRVRRARHAIDVAMGFADAVTSQAMERSRGTQDPGGTPDDPVADQLMLERAHRKIKVAIERLERLIESSPRELRSEVLGLMGSAEKRFAEVMYWSWQASPDSKDPRAEMAREFRAHLKRARDYYWRCFQQEKTGTGWAIVQYIVLSIVIDAVASEPDAAPVAATGEDVNLASLWVTAEQLSRNELSAEPEVRGWALGNLIELNVIVSQVPTLSTWPGVEQRLEVARAYTRQLAETDGPAPAQRFQIYSTRRQLKRYAWWFGRIETLKSVQAAAEGLLRLLPEVSL